MIRLVLCDDHAIVRAGLGRMLETFGDFEIVGEAGSPEEVVPIVVATRPDVVVMDLAMKATDGIAGTKMVLAAVPDAKVTVLTAFLEREKIMDALAAGAVGYLLKDSEPELLAAQLRAVARGELPLDPKATQMVLGPGGLLSPRPVRDDDVSPRELATLALVADGLSNKVIARRLGISEKTVKAHLTNAFRRVGALNRMQAAAWYREHVERTP